MALFSSGEGARRVWWRNRKEHFLILLFILFPFYAFISLGWYAGKQPRTLKTTAVTSTPACFRKLFYFPSVVPPKRLSNRIFFFLNPQHLKTKRIKDSVNRNAFVSSLFFKCFNFFLLFWIFNNRFESYRTSIVCQRPSQTRPCLQISNHGHLPNAVERWGTSSSFEPVFSMPWENKTSITFLWMPTPQGRLRADANPDSVTWGTQPAPVELAVTFRSKPTYP